MPFCDFINRHGAVPRDCLLLPPYLDTWVSELLSLNTIRCSSDTGDPDEIDLNALWSECGTIPTGASVYWHNTTSDLVGVYIWTGSEWTSSGGGSIAYYERILNTQSGHLLALWRLNETGGTDIVDSSPNGYDGTYGPVPTLASILGPDSELYPDFDGTTHKGDLSSVGLIANFNGDEGTILFHLKVESATWTDGAARYAFYFFADADNNILCRKEGGNNEVAWRYEAGGTAQARYKTSVSITNWITMGLTWSASNDRVRAYWGGVQEGSDLTGLGTWAGSLATLALASTGASNRWDGSLACFAVWDVELTPAEMTDLGVE